MWNQIKHFFAPPIFDDPEITRTARLLNATLLGLAIGTLFLSIPLLLSPDKDETTAFSIILALVLSASLFILWIGMRRGYVRFAAISFNIVIYLVITAAGSTSGGVSSPTNSAYLLLIAFASMSIGLRAGITFLVLSILALAGMYYQTTGEASSAATQLVSDASTYSVIFTLMLLILRFAINNQKEALKQIREHEQTLDERNRQLENTQVILETQVTERTRELQRRIQQLQAAAEVGQAAVTFHNLDELLPRVTQLVSERFGFYHAGIFLVDDQREYAILRAANSEGGHRMLARGHRLKVGEVGLVGHATGSGEARIALDVGDNAIYFDNPDLPNTRSEIALPLRARGEIIGALDVQSTQPAAFASEDIEVLRVLADQVSVAISNALLFEEIQARLEAERRAFGELSGEAWHKFTTTHSRISFRSSDQGITTADDIWRPEMEKAIRQKITIQDSNGINVTEEGYPLATPIKVRGNVIGVFNALKPADSNGWLDEEIALFEAIAEQLGVALEGARLYEETQSQAERDQVRADIAGKVLASTDVETILQIAIRELGNILGASTGTIYLSIDDAPHDEALPTIDTMQETD